MFEILEAFKEQTGHDIGENISFLNMNKEKCDICGDRCSLENSKIYNLEFVGDKRVCDDCYNDVFSGEYKK